MSKINIGSIWRFLLVVLVSWGLLIMPAMAQKGTLTSVKTSKAPTIDGKVDGAWSKAEALQIPVNKTPYKPNNGYKGIKKTTVSLKSLNDGEFIYFLVQYADPTKSLERFPWVKQGDGSWKQKVAKDSTGHDNTYYEDKFAMFWNINASGFNKRGCGVACHKARKGKVAGIKDKSPARKYVKKGEFIDMWHWKGVRTNPIGQVDDQYVDSVKDPKVNKNWGRHGDKKTGGGYTNNVSKDKSAPLWMNSKSMAEYKYMVVPSLKTDFVDNFKSGDVVPGISVSPFTGPRADITAKGVYADGKWTIEMKRKLVTTGEKSDEQDVQWSDLGKPYHFGVAVFDNSQINHVYHKGVYQMVFK